jgi:diguanylate cyclase (GGDEF)-like protein
MKTEIVEIIRDTLISLNKKDIKATPKNYSKEFYSIAQAKNPKFKDLEQLNKSIDSLDKNERKLFKNSDYNTYTELSQILLNRIAEDELKDFISVLKELLEPSINYDIEEKNEALLNKLKDSPKNILSKETAKKLKSLSKERVLQDRVVVKEKANDIVKLTSLMGKYFEKSIIQSGNSMSEVKDIKEELNELNLSKHSNREIGALQGKLIDTISTLEDKMQNSRVELIRRQSEFNLLNEQIVSLQKDLKKEKEEKNTDHLTGLLNRRAYEKEIEKFEKKYLLFDSSYAIIFLDIDHFKCINDNHGHDCGDSVLKTFAQILKKLTRDEDKVIRYGGEEFVTLIRYDDKKEVLKYVKRIKNLIDKNKFVFNDIKLKIKFSAGATLRENYDSYTDTVNTADELLYKAKRSGRDKIIMDDETIV